MHTWVLVVHVVAGSSGLLLGPVAMLARKGPGLHPRVGRAYQGATAALCLSAFGLVAYKPALWWLGVIGTATWGAALGGWWVRRRGFDGWLAWHIGLMCGSYVSFVTAFLVVNLGFGSVLAWILPTLVGTPLIGRTIAGAVRRPAVRADAASEAEVAAGVGTGA
ncbi:hypothetical protein ACEZCY_21665 [Streptacidiphilus sp. N1-12]|uniref:DUF2306 domain-containing protein n=2 Tax=Streptacidiphilus alkalitolerans TaxID=3342712 RepID=A0ABV6WIC6_9ACTN